MHVHDFEYRWQSSRELNVHVYSISVSPMLCKCCIVAIIYTIVTVLCHVASYSIQQNRCMFIISSTDGKLQC